MRIVLVADTFPPLRSSGAVQLRDLSTEFVNQGHEIAVLVASPSLSTPWVLEDFNGVEVLRLRTPPIKDIGYVRRTLGEFLMPFVMWHNYKKSPLCHRVWDGVVWYSPSIFLGPIVNFLKKTSQCNSYLIIRDIFPEWAVDMGLMGRGLPYLFFKSIAKYQYSVADTIGIQTPGNRVYFNNESSHSSCRVEVLQNWLADHPGRACSIDLSISSLRGRKIFVYAGNMGIAQGMGILLDLAAAMKYRADVGFLFVGRGSDALLLCQDALARGLDNVLFYDEIDPYEIPMLYQQCDIGLVALDPRHKTHNIPGKFLSYMQAGLPVLAAVNPGNDLVDLIAKERVGQVCADALLATLIYKAEHLIDNLQMDASMHDRCKALAARLFSPSVAVRQIVEALRA